MTVSLGVNLVLGFLWLSFKREEAKKWKGHIPVYLLVRPGVSGHCLTSDDVFGWFSSLRAAEAARLEIARGREWDSVVSGLSEIHVMGATRGILERLGYIPKRRKPTAGIILGVNDR